MSTSFLDVTSFQATVGENNTLEVVLKMRDIPLTAERGGTRNVAEYSVLVTIYADPKTATSTASPDFQLMAVAASFDPPDSSNPSGILIPKPGEMTVFPMNKFWSYGSVSDLQIGDTIGNFEPVVDPEADTLTLRARIPGITSDAVMSYTTRRYADEVDGPDFAESSGPILAAATDASPTASTSVQTNEPGQLVPASEVHAYPGPAHYAGDILTFEIPSFDGSPENEQKATLKLDQNEPFEVTGQWSYYNELILPLALDTSGLTGTHTLQITTPDDIINTTYTFEVLPASKSPADEQNTAWMLRMTACCIFHYVSNTAAERDIQSIAEHFQKAANDFSKTTGKSLNTKMEVYFIDRLVYNGGFGGNGNLFVSYTDRYYGPTVNWDDWETLARHEFSHAAGVGLENLGDGIDFNYEGLAVYIAGGHYKPEPLAERGAALFDLGYYVPVGQFIEQHELSYLYSAAMLTYIADAYGKDTVWKFLAADNDASDGQPGPLDIAIQNTFSISQDQFNDGFRTWLQDHDPGTQLDDLRLTIKLQDLRRQYQDTYVPAPYLLLGNDMRDVTRPEFLPLILRESQSPANTAIELLIANGQEAIIEGDYSTAEQIINTLENILSSRNFETPPASDYLAIATTLIERGYSVDSLRVSDNSATAQVSTNTPTLLTMQLQKSADGWVILP
ncbi:MAG TPA: hypothetical protein VN653_07950 [Anaerolineales bacterium]|nr:hypothetical protein [Anaerolineales bacterium]